MTHIHSILIDRKTGEIINYKVTPVEMSLNHQPLTNYMLKKLEELKFISENEDEA